MIEFLWGGVVTTATIQDGQWVHGLPEVVAMLSRFDPTDPDSLDKAAAHLGGSVVR
jgi:hypothetical protein